MQQTYPLTTAEKLDRVARAAFERSQPRHQETLHHLRYLASTLSPLSL